MRMVALLVAFLFLAFPAAAQQAVRIPLPLEGNRKLMLPAQLYLPSKVPAPAVTIFHGCGGPGVNNARMAQLLQGWGYVAVVVDSFSPRGLKDVCGRNWPSQRMAEERSLDIGAVSEWLDSQSFAKGSQTVVMGYSYGGGVALLNGMTNAVEHKTASVRGYILVYPDCALAEALGPRLRPRAPMLLAMGELDDWTPVSQCRAVIDRVVRDREEIETRIYPGAHHSFDALGLPVRYLAGVGNRSKPGGCCGAHYGAHEPAWRAFVEDVKAFLARRLPL
jgi:dienelactone hydrolase